MADAETMEVELLSGVKVTLPKEQAQKEIEHRQRFKADLRTQAEELGKIKAEKDAAASAAEAAARKAEADIALKAGEYEKAKEIIERTSVEKIGKLERGYRHARLHSLISGNAGLIPEAAGDIAAALAGSCRYDLETEQLYAVDGAGKPRIGQDGKPLGADALIAEFTDSRPYLRKAATPPGSGADGKQTSKETTVSRTQWAAMTGAQKSAFATAGGKVSE